MKKYYEDERRKGKRKRSHDESFDGWDGTNRRRDERRCDGNIDPQVFEKQQVKLDRREKERRIADKRKRDRMKKELGFH